MVCKKCGNQMNDDEKFCKKCGAPVDEEASEAPKSQPKDQNPASAKTRLGLTVGLLAAVAYLCCLSGYAALVLIVIAGYVLLAEENLFLRKSVVKALAVAACFLLLNVAIGLVPNFLSFLNKLLGETGWVKDFSASTGYRVINGIFGALAALLKLVKIVFVVLLGVFAFRGKNIRLPLIDNLIDKHVK